MWHITPYRLIRFSRLLDLFSSMDFSVSSLCCVSAVWVFPLPNLTEESGGVKTQDSHPLCRRHAVSPFNWPITELAVWGKESSECETCSTGHLFFQEGSKRDGGDPHTHRCRHWKAVRPADRIIMGSRDQHQCPILCISVASTRTLFHNAANQSYYGLAQQSHHQSSFYIFHRLRWMLAVIDLFLKSVLELK